MSFTCTYRGTSTPLSLADGAEKIVTLWLDGWSVHLERNAEGGVKVVPPTPKGLGLADSLAYGDREAYYLCGTTDLARSTLAVLRLILKPGGGNRGDIASAVAALDRLRSTENGIGREREDFHPAAFARPDQDKVASALLIVAGLPYSYGGRRPSREVLIAAALKRLTELEAA